MATTGEDRANIKDITTNHIIKIKQTLPPIN
jgi:hypothetical protein